MHLLDHFLSGMLLDKILNIQKLKKPLSPAIGQKEIVSKRVSANV